MSIFRPNKTKQTSTSSSGLAKKKGFKPKWWMAAILVVIVAGVGIAVLRFSRASGSPTDQEVMNTMSLFGHQYFGVNFISIRKTDGSTATAAVLPVSNDMSDLARSLGEQDGFNFTNGVLYFSPNGPGQPGSKLPSLNLRLGGDSSRRCFAFHNEKGQNTAIGLIEQSERLQLASDILGIVSLFGKTLVAVSFNTLLAGVQQVFNDYNPDSTGYIHKLLIQGEFFHCGGQNSWGSDSTNYKGSEVYKAIYEMARRKYHPTPIELAAGQVLQTTQQAPNPPQQTTNPSANQLTVAWQQDDIDCHRKYATSNPLYNLLCRKFPTDSVWGLLPNERWPYTPINAPTSTPLPPAATSGPTATPGCVAGAGQACATGIWDFLGGNINPPSPGAPFHDYGIWKSRSTGACGVKSGGTGNAPKVEGIFWTTSCQYANTNPPPPPPKLCTNGNIDQTPLLLCDDGNWEAIPRAEFAGKTYEYFVNKDNRNECAVRTGAPINTLPAKPGYMYPANCSDLEQVKQWAFNAFFNKELGPKAFALQDVYPSGNTNAGKVISTSAQKATYFMKQGSMLTPTDWLKPNRPSPPYFGFPAFFIPNYRGLYSLNDPAHNFYGNIWGYVDGQFVAASNMAQYGKGGGATGVNMLNGPFENPGGNTYNALGNGKKVMKVCWTIKDIQAAQTGNTQHSAVILKVTANGGTRTLSTGTNTSGLTTLSGTEFKEYCQDNIRITQQDTGNLEYPVNYYSGAIAVSKIERTIYWPSANYSINLPTPASFSYLSSTIDPLIRQNGVSGDACSKEGSNCKITSAAPISVSSEVFGSNSSTGKKEICVRATRPAGAGLYVTLYGENTTKALIAMPLDRVVVLWDLSTLYCSPRPLVFNQFKSLVLSTSATDLMPAKINILTVNNLN